MRWLIVGAGQSGLAAAELLRSRNETVRISEGRPLPSDIKSDLIDQNVEVFDGGHDQKHLVGIDRLIVSPGIPLSIPLLVQARSQGLKIENEVDLAFANYQGHSVAVTGTNGKSTTCLIVAELLSTPELPVRICGNFGIPACRLASANQLSDPLVIELSSYQIETLEQFKPLFSIFTSFSEDHVQRHGTLEAYFRLKWRLMQMTRPEGWVIMSQPIVQKAVEFGMSLDDLQAHCLIISQEKNRISLPKKFRIFHIEARQLDVGTEKIEIPNAPGLMGYHNVMNACLALSCAHLLSGASLELLATKLTNFRGLKYRCEKISEINGFSIINDSKSTNLESVMVALTTVTAPCYLLLGGKPKGEDFSALVPYLGKVRAIVAFGESADAIEHSLASSIEVKAFSRLSDAIEHVKAQVEVHPAHILFSPGCASFDEFKNFEHRGSFFEECFKTIIPETN